MAGKDQPGSQLYRVREPFAVPGEGGILRPYAVGALVAGDDPIATTHRALLESASSAVEQATAAPGERRLLGLRLPSGVGVRQATQHNTGSAHDTPPAHTRVPDPISEGGSTVVHALPPEDEMSPASTFASDQPGRGVVADDVPDAQNAARGEKAEDAAVKDSNARKGRRVTSGGNKAGGELATGGDNDKDGDPADSTKDASAS